VFARQLVKEAVANSTRRFQIALGIMAALIVVLGGVLVHNVINSREAQRMMEERHRAEQAEGDRLLALLTENRVAREEMERRLDDQAKKLDDDIRQGLSNLAVRGREREALLKDLSSEADRISRRMTAAEVQAGAAKRIHKNYHRGVCFIYTGISFYHEDRKKFLRKALDPATGEPEIAVQLGGKGPKHMEWISGSGFVVDKTGVVLSNRHVIDPWYEDAEFGAPLLGKGFRTVREVFIACFPGRDEPIPLQRVAVHADQDIAAARLTQMHDDIPVLPIATVEHRLESGMDVYVLGYPEGLWGMIHKLPGEAARALVRRSGDRNRSLVLNLTKMKRIEPVFTRGTLSNTSGTQLVYDAVTYSGGSGGPVFNEAQMVVGINTAISRNFTGANYGTPIRFAREFLQSADLKSVAVEAPELAKDLAVEDKK
jgi:hypothetical protein